MTTEQAMNLLQRILTLREPYRSLVLHKVSALIDQAEQAFPKEPLKVEGLADVPETV